MNLTQNRIFIKTILSFIMHTGRLISTLYNHQFRYDLQNNRFHSVHVTRDVELFLKNKNKFCLGYISAKYNKTPNYSSYWSATTSWQRVLTHIEVLPGDLCLWKSVLLPSAVRVYIKKKNDLLKQLILKFQNGLKIFTGSPKSYLSYHVFRRIIRITRRMLRKCWVNYKKKKLKLLICWNYLFVDRRTLFPLTTSFSGCRSMVNSTIHSVFPHLLSAALEVYVRSNWRTPPRIASLKHYCELFDRIF